MNNFFFFFDEEDKMESKELSGNVGEWSEPYVLFRLLADSKLFAADEKLQKLSDTYFPILKILRLEKKENSKNEYNKIDFIVKNEEEIEVYFNDTLFRTLSKAEFEQEAEFLFSQIHNKDKGNLTIERSKNFLNSINCYTLKASSQDKTDITIQIHDINTGYNPVCGFSIKSHIGSLPSLINATEATNFVFEIKNLSEEQIKQINEIKTSKKIIDRMDFIKQSGGELVFYRMKNPIYAENLLYIDSGMPLLLSWALKYSYLENVISVKDVVNLLQTRNPMHFPENKKYYEYKFKKFLCSAALGMMPATEWEGKDEANGGYIVAKENGEVLAYHIYNRDKFEEYLFNNTKFERGSTSKHGFATVYEEDGKFLINLNLQIRFTK